MGECAVYRCWPVYGTERTTREWCVRTCALLRACAFGLQVFVRISFAGVCALFGCRVRACVRCVWFLEVHACLVYENNELTKQEHVNHGRFMSSKRMG